MIENPVPGEKYKHYKGGRYYVLHLAKHTETEAVEVVYMSLDYGTVWVRPLNVWTTFAMQPNGLLVPRFQKEST